MYVCRPTNTADGHAEKFPTLDRAIKYCSAARALDIRAVVLNDKGEVIYRNYQTYALCGSWV